MQGMSPLCTQYFYLKRSY